MLQYLVLLALTDGDISYDSVGIHRSIQSQLGKEVAIPEQKEFDSIIMDMANRCLIDITHGTLAISQTGKAKLQNSEMLSWIYNHFEKFTPSI